MTTKEELERQLEEARNLFKKVMSQFYDLKLEIVEAEVQAYKAFNKFIDASQQYYNGSRSEELMWQRDEAEKRYEEARHRVRQLELMALKEECVADEAWNRIRKATQQYYYILEPDL